MKKLLLFALLSSVSAFGQAYSDSVTQNSPGNYGRPVPFASVQVCNIADTATPCTQKVNTFTNDSLGVACTQSAGSGVLTGAPSSGANCNNPGIADANGNFTIYVVPGQYRICTYANNWLCQNVSIGGSGGGIPFACASAVNGSIVAMTSTTTSSCDPNGVTDFIGHWTSQSYRATGAFNGTVELTGGLADPTNPPDTNSVAFLAPATAPTPFYLRLPASLGTVGNCLTNFNQAIGTNGTIVTLNWAACGGILLQTNTVDNSTQAKLNLIAGSNITLNESSGNVTITGSAGGLPTTQIGTPTAPTLSTNGSAGSTSYTYLVVGCEDPACVYHTSPSATTTIATGNATLTSSNSINLSVYGDTLYGPRGYIICRTASSGTPSSIGVITGGLIAGKKFVDTGLAGNGANCATLYATNTTILEIDMNSNPGCNVPLGGHLLVDAPPCTPNAANDEARQTHGAPGDVNNTVWAWVNQGSATAVWSGGTIFLSSDTTASSNMEMLAETTALPATPYTYIAYVDLLSPTATAGCALGLRETSTGKMATTLVFNNETLDGFTAQGGTLVGALNWTSVTANSVIHSMAYKSDGYYLKIQNTGSAINFSWSPSGDGVNYLQLATEAVGTAFTTAPNQLVIGVNSASTAAACTYDYVRRTQ